MNYIFQTNLFLFIKFKGNRSKQNKQYGSRQVTTPVEDEVVFYFKIDENKITYKF